MKYVRSIITVLLLLWRLPVSLGEAGIAWDILNQEAQESQDKGQYNRAVIVAKKARERAEKNVGPRQPDVSGRLSVIWGDPPASSQAQPTMDWFLTDNQGKVTALDLGQDLIRQHGGWRALNTKRVTIETGFVDGGRIV